MKAILFAICDLCSTCDVCVLITLQYEVHCDCSAHEFQSMPVGEVQLVLVPYPLPL